MDSGSESSAFYNGRIVTFDPTKGLARAIAVSQGRIIAVGDERKVVQAGDRGSDRVDLRGRTVIPAFTDCHTHFIQMGVDSMNVDLSRTRSLDEALALIKQRAAKTLEGEWVIASSWKESGWPDGRFITRDDLDSCCPDNPAVAHRVCGHLSTVNSQAISELGIEAGKSGVDVDSTGRITGILKEEAVGITRAATAPGKERRARGLMLAMKMAHALGVSAVHDNGESSDLEVYAEAERSGRLKVRVWFNTPSKDLEHRIGMSAATGIGSDWLRLGGVKVFCDGALGARTAALSKPYADDPGNKGMLVHKRRALERIVSDAHGAGLQLAIHAIGDRGIDEVLSVLTRCLDEVPRKDCRHRIEHLELPSRRHLREMRRLGVTASMQPNFIGEWGGTDGMYLSRLGRARTERNNPFKEVLAAGVRLVFGSDCMPFSPAYGIESAVNAPHPSQRISAREAIAAFTRDAAFASFQEKDKGTLAKGKFADFAVLSSDPFTPGKTVCNVEVLMTVAGGVTVYKAKGKGA